MDYSFSLKNLQKQILIIDDDALISKPICYAFRTSGFDVSVAENFEEAGEKLKRKTPHLILLDLIVSCKINGFDFLKSLKEHSTFSLIPVLVMSSLSQKDDIDFCFENGAKAYMVKSEFSLHDILKKAEEILAEGEKEGVSTK